MQVAIGFRVHTGWAAMVAVAGPSASPQVIDRSRIALAEDQPVEALQAYHQAAELPLSEARSLVTRSQRAARGIAVASMREALARLREHHVVQRGAIVAGNSQLPRELAAVLRSHAMIHTAEGEMFRSALAAACVEHGVSIVEIPSRDLEARAHAVLGFDGAKLRTRLAELGKGLGAPWARDQKDAALVAWLALSGTR